MDDNIKKQIVALILGVKNQDPQATQIMQDIMNKAKQGDQKAIALAKAIQTVMQEMEGGQPQSEQPVAAKFGAKLNYIRELKGNAPEGMVVEYYKCGGQTKKRFVKAAGGEKVKDGKKEIANFKKQRGCKGMKTKKKLLGGELGGNIRDKRVIKPGESAFEEDPVPDIFILKTLKLGGEFKGTKKACGGWKAKKHQSGGSLNRIPFIKAGIR